MHTPVTHPHLQFRFWCGAAQSHVSDYKYNGRVDELFQGDDMLVTEQCTGLKDIDGRYVYEGDILRIPITADMPVWEGGVPVGAGALDALGTDESGDIILEVTRDPACPSNLYLSGRAASRVELFLPVSWVRKGAVIGRRAANCL